MENENINVTQREDTVKDKAVLFAIGALVGVVASTGAFFAYIFLANTNSSDIAYKQSPMMQGGAPPGMPGGNNSSNGQGDAPPGIPNNNSSNNNDIESS